MNSSKYYCPTGYIISFNIIHTTILLGEYYYYSNYTEEEKGLKEVK